MLKVLLNLILNIIVGNLKPILLKHIENVSAEDLTNDKKRKVVFDALTADAKTAGKTIGDSLKNLAIETGLQILKDKIK